MVLRSHIGKEGYKSADHHKIGTLRVRGEFPPRVEAVRSDPEYVETPSGCFVVQNWCAPFFEVADSLLHLYCDTSFSV